VCGAYEHLARVYDGSAPQYACRVAEDEFSEVMARRTDAELIAIVTVERDDYQDEALRAAEAEVQRRKLSTKRIDKLTRGVDRQHDVKRQRAREPLDAFWKGAAFLFPGIANIVIGRHLWEKGYVRKYEDVRKWTIYGVAFYVATLILVKLVHSLR
jgi:hypothetical protein